jgi:transposase
MRGLCTVFHQTGASSSQSSVEQVWKLCKKSSKRKVGPESPTASAARGTYFGHERFVAKRVPAG